MAQETLVVRIPRQDQAGLRERLSQGVFEYRQVPHAVFSVKGEGVVATLYTSGKLVVQGEDPALFVARFLGADHGAASPPPVAPPTTMAPAVTTVGSDEAGKGDYFGPLVVCAMRVEAARAAELVAAGVADSKRLSDARALRLGAWLRAELPHALRVIMPEEYGRQWEREGLHGLLSRAHAEAIREVAEAGDRVVIDQFSKKDEIGPRLTDLDLRIEQRPRAEAEVAVAAASILARAEFLLGLRELGQELELELPKGAGEPVDVAGVELVRRHGEEGLRRVAKLHFKNTEKVRARLAEEDSR